MCDNLGEKIASGRWTLKDRLYQLKGLLDLYDTSKKWADQEMEETSKARAKEIKELSNSERAIREAVHYCTAEGDLEGINVLLKQDPTLETLCKGKSFTECEEIVSQLIFVKRKELDSLVYDLQQKEEDFMHNQYKMELMKIPAKIDAKKPAYMFRATEIEAEIENIYTRHEAAVVVRDSYDKIRKILKKDSRCFDTILGGLQLDAIVQCQCVIKAMELGQAAIVDGARSRDKYNKLNKEFKEIERERELKISQIKKKIAKANNVHSKLIRSESVTKLLSSGGAYSNKQTADSYTKKLILENDKLEETMVKLKELCQVPNRIDIFFRAERIEEKKHRLMRQIDINNMWLKTELIRNNHIKSMNEKLLHCVTDEAKEWIAERKQYLSDIAELEKEYCLLKLEESIEAKILADIQMQLTHLQRIVEPIRVGAFKMEKLDANLKTIERRILRIGDEGAWGEQNSALNFLKLALKAEDEVSGEVSEDARPAALMDVCQILDVISAKIDIIKTQVGDLNNISSKGSFYYKEYMNNRATFFQTFMPKFEVEAEDDADALKDKLLTREEMKEQSKRLVAALKEKPKAPTGPSVFTVKKHSCY